MESNWISEKPIKPICINGISSNLCSSIRGKECECAKYERQLKQWEVFLPKKNPDMVRATSDWSETECYWIADRRPKVGEWYIDMFVTEKERSIQKHETIKQLRNHQRDYRFKHCCVVVASTNLNIKFNQ